MTGTQRSMKVVSHRTDWSGHKQLRIALFISGLAVGGVQRSMLTLAHAFSSQGHRVDLVVPNIEGSFRPLVPPAVRLVNIERWWMRLPWIRSRKRRRALVCAPALAVYLRQKRPDVLLSASHYVNLTAVWGRCLAKTRTPLVISQRTHLSQAITNTNFPGGRRPVLGWFAQRFYPAADAIVAVSNGVADDLARTTKLPRLRIQTIYNPVVTPELKKQAQVSPSHPWFSPGSPPVVLGVGRLAAQKDFVTLLRAFAQVRAKRHVRLLILGEGRKRTELEALVKTLGLAADVALPGFCDNPFSYMSHAAVFVLSSTYEGLPGVLIQAMACGCPVVSTDCPSGPAEILDNGRYGPLVPVGNARAMADAIVATLDRSIDRAGSQSRSAQFSVETCTEQYINLFQAIISRCSPAGSATVLAPASDR